MSKFSKIEVRAANTQTAVLEHECDIVDDRFDSIKEAKDRVRYWLSRDYERYNAPDPVTPIRYAQIWVTEDHESYCHSDFFAKGYNGETDFTD